LAKSPRVICIQLPLIARATIPHLQPIRRRLNFARSENIAVRHKGKACTLRPVFRPSRLAINLAYREVTFSGA
ncbi:hypothetical protein B0T26DRAFT_725166, partial [Lasiosphaeria miniovina]